MRDIDYDTIQEMTDIRFPGTSFSISCFNSVEEIVDKPVTWIHDTIIIAYYYCSEYYKHLNIELQDIDYISVSKKEGEQYIRYCDVIDAIMGMEIAGALKPNHHLYLEDIVRVENDRNRVPMYRIGWGS